MPWQNSFDNVLCDWILKVNVYWPWMLWNPLFETCLHDGICIQDSLVIFYLRILFLQFWDVQLCVFFCFVFEHSNINLSYKGCKKGASRPIMFVACLPEFSQLDCVLSFCFTLMTTNVFVREVKEKWIRFLSSFLQTTRSDEFTCVLKLLEVFLVDWEFAFIAVIYKTLQTLLVCSWWILYIWGTNFSRLLAEKTCTHLAIFLFD